MSKDIFGGWSTIKPRHPGKYWWKPVDYIWVEDYKPVLVDYDEKEDGFWKPAGYFVHNGWSATKPKSSGKYWWKPVNYMWFENCKPILVDHDEKETGFWKPAGVQSVNLTQEDDMPESVSGSNMAKQKTATELAKSVFNASCGTETSNVGSTKIKTFFPKKNRYVEIWSLEPGTFFLSKDDQKRLFIFMGPEKNERGQGWFPTAWSINEGTAHGFHVDELVQIVEFVEITVFINKGEQDGRIDKIGHRRL
jgi:hypothetical protein